MLDHVSSGDFRLVQFRSDYITLGWFRTGYVRLCQVISSLSGYFSLYEVRPGYVRLIHVRAP